MTEKKRNPMLLEGEELPSFNMPVELPKRDPSKKNPMLDEEEDLPPFMMEPPPSSVQFEKDVLKEQKKMSWPKYLRQWEKDLDNLILSGATYGGSTHPALQGGPDIPYTMDTPTPEEMAAARARTGIIGQGAEIAGGVASPFTRLISMGGAAALPYLQKFAGPITSRVIGGAGEGATAGVLSGTLSGHSPEDMRDEALWSSVIGGAIPLVGPSLKGTASFLSGKKKELYDTLFEAGKEGGLVNETAKQGLKGKPSSAGKFYETIDASVKGQTPVDFAPINQTAIKEVKKHFAGNYGPFKGERGPGKKGGDYARVLAIDEIVDEMSQYPHTAENFDAFRRQLGKYTKPYSSKGKYRPSSPTATNIQKAIKAEIDKAVPGYVDSLEKYGKAKAAHDVGKEMREGSAQWRGILSALGSVAAGGGAYVLSNPTALALAIPAAIGSSLAGSPKLGGNIARMAGATRRGFGQTNPASIFTQLWLQSERERLDRRKRNKGEK